MIKYKGLEVDPQKLRRQAKMETRRNLMDAQVRDPRPDDTLLSSPLMSSAGLL